MTSYRIESCSPPEDTRGDSEVRLQGPPLWCLRIACFLILGSTVALIVRSVPAAWTYLGSVCRSGPCESRLTPAGVEALGSYGSSPEAYALWLLSLELLYPAVSLAVAVLLLVRRSDRPMALYAATMLVASSGQFAPLYELARVQPGFDAAVSAVDFVSLALLFTFGLLFPTGRFVPRWTWIVAVCAVPVLALRSIGGGEEHWALDLLPFFVFLPVGIAAQIHRYRRHSDRAQRQQTKWVLWGMTTAFLGFLGLVATFAVAFPELPEDPLVNLAATTALYLTMLLIPLSIGAAVLRYRLWTVDPLIDRTLLYTALTVAIVAGYVLIIGGLGALLQHRFAFLTSLLATGVVAVAFHPLRTVLERLVNRLLYGDRDEPYAVLARMGKRLEESLLPHQVLPATVDTVAEALKLPFAAVVLGPASSPDAVIERGAATGELRSFPLVHRGERVGELKLQPRSRHEPFTADELDLVGTICRQLGVLAFAARQGIDLQRSRRQLVVAREEERLRLRRDLHDGLGSNLAGITMKVDAALNLMDREPQRSVQLLRDLKAQTRDVIRDIRALVHDLRPPALDDLGLAIALREEIARFAGADLRITTSVPASLPKLPAAVEVAAYRILQEAIANVARHASARTCRVEVRVDDALSLVVEDDGSGLRGAVEHGLGLPSMRARAEEIGGRFEITSRPGGGTRVLASLPLEPPT